MSIISFSSRRVSRFASLSAWESPAKICNRRVIPAGSGCRRNRRAKLGARESAKAASTAWLCLTLTALQRWLGTLAINVFFEVAFVAIAIAIAIGGRVLRLIFAENNSKDTSTREMQPFQSVSDDSATSFSA